MEGLIIFDIQNDIVYKNMCPEIVSKIMQMAISQELFLPNSDESVDNNIILQLFSPLINSQRIMFCQFDNTYTAIECENDLKFVFAEFLDYIFLRIGSQTVDFLQRSMAISINFAKNFVGPNIGILKTDNEKAASFTDCLESWKELYNLEQGVLLEGVEQLIVNSDLKAIACKALEAAVEKLEQNPRTQNCHGILFVKGKFLGLVSSKQAQKLSSSDVLFISILSKNIQENHNGRSTNAQNNYLLFLQGHKNSASSGCVPHFVHFFLLEKGVILTILIEYGNLQIACSLYDTFFALHKTQHVQMQGDFENLRFSFNKLDSCVKQCFDALKKAKYNNASIESSAQKLNLKWEILKRKYIEFFKTFEKDLNVKIESNTPAFKNEIKELFTLIYMKCIFYEQDFDNVLNISTLVEGKLLEFVEFLSVKAQRNLSIESYLEEFPGLVHFIFVDRFNGIVIAPDLCNMTCLIPKDKVWSMVEYSRSHLKQGHTSVAWKDTALNYSYFLWFEDQSGIFVKPKDTQNNFGSFVVVRPQHEPGILGGDYYQRLYELCFPKSAKKIKCFELYCIHLGLVTSTCALEHSRRLAATINDVTGALSLELS